MNFKRGGNVAKTNVAYTNVTISIFLLFKSFVLNSRLVVIFGLVPLLIGTRVKQTVGLNVDNNSQK